MSDNRQMYCELRDFLGHHQPKCEMSLTRCVPPNQEIRFVDVRGNNRIELGSVKGLNLKDWSHSQDNSIVEITKIDGSSFTIETNARDCKITDYNELISFLLGPEVEVLPDYPKGCGFHESDFQLHQCNEKCISCSYNSFDTIYDAECTPEEFEKADIFNDSVVVYLKGNNINCMFRIPIKWIQ